MGVTRHPLCSTETSERLRSVPADEALIRRLQESFSRIELGPVDFAERFYARLFERHPGLRTMFPADMSAQTRKFFETLRMVIESLQAPSTARSKLEDLGRGHVKYGVKPEHYPLVCDMIVATFAELSGSDWTADLSLDWSNALRLVSEIMLDGAKTAQD